MRVWLLIDSVLVLVAGIQLFVFTAHTERLFAWTITPPLTAAFLGASYWASLPLVYLSSRRTTWAQARLAVFGVLVFTILTTVATLLHLDRFHLSGPTQGAQFAAWTWLAVYAVVPLALLALLILQLRLLGGDPARRAPLPEWMRHLLGLQALVMLMMGGLLFVAPVAPLWPWRLTPLTGRAVGAWLIGIGIIAGHARWENDAARVRAGMVSYTLLACLQLLAVARYAQFVDWNRFHAPVYLVFLVTILCVGGYGWFVARDGDRDGNLTEGDT
jgi:hypothetical protein